MKKKRLPSTEGVTIHAKSDDTSSFFEAAAKAGRLADVVFSPQKTKRRPKSQAPVIGTVGSSASGKTNTIGAQLLDSFLKLEDLHPLNQFLSDEYQAVLALEKMCPMKSRRMHGKK